ncbi:MAG: ACT domain-containing protein, partial [Bacteroidota bacterium]
MRTDVNGIMSTDPRLVKEAFSIKKVSFAEASELAFFGAKVLHPKTIIPAIKNKIPVKVLNTYKPDHPGTAILESAEKTDEVVKAIAAKKDSTLVNINSTRMLAAHGFLAKVFEIFAKNKISVDMISTSEVNISLTIDNGTDLSKTITDLEKFAEVKVEEGKSIVCVVGEGLKNTVGLAKKVFGAVSEK